VLDVPLVLDPRRAQLPAAGGGVIYFGSCAGHPEKLEAHARPGLTASMLEGYVHLTPPGDGKDIFPVYAGMMREASRAGAEMLVLMHDDLEFRDGMLAAKLRDAFADPSVAIVGLIGSRGAKGVEWWFGERAGRVTDLAIGLHDFGFTNPTVDSLDGMMLALSPWALENLTLEGFGYKGFHGYDAELCFQARKAGKRVVVADITATHHSAGGFTQGLADAEAVFQRRWFGDPRLAAMIQKVREAGTDSLAHFGNGYTHEGGLYLQQNPEEFAQLALLLKDRARPTDTYLEIGSASGGACRFLDDECLFGSVVSLDDGNHARAKYQAELLPNRIWRFRGDSHSAEAVAFLAQRQSPDVAFIDGDHSYEGVTADIAMVLPRCEPGALIILHDTVACEGVRRAWEELLMSGRAKKVAEFVGAEKPLGIGVAEVIEQSIVVPVDHWAPLRSTTADQWDVEAVFAAHRGGPVSATPFVMLATPAYNPPGLEFLNVREAVIQDLHTHGINVTALLTPGDSLVMRGRHTIVHEFLKSEATHLLFCDADIVPCDPTVVRQMLATGHEIIGGACPFRGETGQVVCNIRQVDKDRKLIDTDDTGSVQVNEVGTGFLLMARTAIVAMCERYPELMYFADLPNAYGEPMWALFDTKIVNRRFLSEDYFFCQLWRDMGESVYVYVPFEAEHWGRKAFRASFTTALGMRAPE
jgi:cephalosporin hydroxylase